MGDSMTSVASSSPPILLPNFITYDVVFSSPLLWFCLLFRTILFVTDSPTYDNDFGVSVIPRLIPTPSVFCPPTWMAALAVSMPHMCLCFIVHVSDVLPSCRLQKLKVTRRSGLQGLVPDLIPATSSNTITDDTDYLEYVDTGAPALESHVREDSDKPESNVAVHRSLISIHYVEDLDNNQHNNTLPLRLSS
ncbi:hypothetical protein BXZ70DRAFT_245005 [Cristinia sonorae]|uniref:Uncharacterized protein n=1 Tax=Cristinia sonorae TaxID=1940300 RepID=A0A8K0XUB0_9AGAR|nr:hypothetical protein BXZ70DRAFT_245005 [Cristinia sonorae]